MFRKSVFIMLFVCLLATVSSAVNLPTNWWVYQLEWKAGTDANWYVSGNWNPETEAEPLPPGMGPDANNRTCILPNQPGPRITGSAKSYVLDIDPWDATSWGAQDANLSIMSTATDVNFGSCIRICAGDSWDSYVGTPTISSRGIINVYGGTVTTPGPYISPTWGCGLHVGGGADGYAFAYGILNMYGGEVNVPRLELHFGEIGLYGGTLRVNSDVNFSVSTDHALAQYNLIKVDGGTFKLLGDQTVTLNSLISTSHIVSERGVLGTPTFAGGWTTLESSDINYCTWSPTPVNGATNVHYKTAGTDACSITLSWRPSTFEDRDVNHDVYFGASYPDVCNATKADANYCYMGSICDDVCDPCSYIVKDPNKFLPNTTYYWRVDESSVGNPFKKGRVWNFKTHDGKAYNPNPANAGTDANGKGLNASLQLTWTAGDWADTHKVYFTTIAGGGNLSNPAFPRPTDKQYRGVVSSPVYPLSKLLEDLDSNGIPDWGITAGTTYYWLVDEVNGSTTWKGPLWSFTPALYTTIDDFEDYQSTDDVNTNWPYGYTLTPTGGVGNCNNPVAKGYAGRILQRNSSGKYMQYIYNNYNPAGGYGMSFTEGKRSYTSIGSTDFTGGGIISPATKALLIDYRSVVRAAGDSRVNAANVASIYCSNDDPNKLDLDRMYVAIEDTAGHVGIYLNPDPYAQQVTNWTTWYVNLYDINNIAHGFDSTGAPATVNLKAITGFAIGFGMRSNTIDSDGNDVNSIVWFDNIRLLAATCNPQFAKESGLTADFDNDCDVDINDLDSFVNDWLWAAVPQHNITTTVPHKAPVIWYKFNESSGFTAADSGPGSYTADVCNTGDVMWEPTGGRNGAGCLNFNAITSQNTRVEVPVAAFNFMADANHYSNGGNGGSISFSVWTNGVKKDVTMTNNWCTVFSVYPVGWGNGNGIAWLSLPSRWDNPLVDFQQMPAGSINGVSAYGPLMPENYFGGRWNHWAAVKSEPNTLIAYCNGREIVRTTDVNAGVPFFKLPLQSFRIGMRGGSWANWGKWSGEMQDFKVYDYALDANEVGYLATDGTGIVGFIPLVCPANLNLDGAASPDTDPNQIVNFGDLATMGKQWHTQVLWP